MIPRKRNNDLTQLKDIMKDAKQIMRRKVLFGNAMPKGEDNTKMAEDAFSEAIPVSLSLTQIQNRTVWLRTLCGITSTVRGTFKNEARRLVLCRYDSLSSLETSDSRPDAEHRRDAVSLLLKDHAYLFVSRSFFNFER